MAMSFGSVRRRFRAIAAIGEPEAMIPSSDPGIKLYVRNKHAEDMTSFSPDKTLLFIHGATYPAETSFDLPIEGVSMMDLFAQSGFDVYLVDVRSYGRSTRPPEMDQPPEANKPIATSDEAGADLGAAVDYVLALRGIPKLDLMGWSWGTSIAGNYAASTMTRSVGLFFTRRSGRFNLRSSRRRTDPGLSPGGEGRSEGALAQRRP